MNDPAEMRVGGPGLGAMGGGKLSMMHARLPFPDRIDAAANEGSRRACTPLKGGPPAGTSACPGQMRD